MERFWTQTYTVVGCILESDHHTICGDHYCTHQFDGWERTPDSVDCTLIKLTWLHTSITKHQKGCVATSTSSMTSPVMKKNVWYLHLLMTTSSSAQRRALLDTITNEQLKSLTELTHNLLQGNIPITETQKRNLRKHKMFLRILGNPKVSFLQKREALCQKGGVVVTVLKIAAPQLRLFL